MQFSEAYVEHSSKHKDYFPIYDNIFSNIDRKKSYKILEIGVDIGSGVRALKTFFPNSQIYGLDIKRECKKHEEENINIIIGSQVDDNILENLSNIEFDLIIDDGSHHNNHVYYTFEKLFKSLNTEKVGLYVVEDIHTAYWPYYGGGYKDRKSTIEKFKNLIDHQNLWCIRDPIKCHRPPYPGKKINETYYEKWLEFIQFYENIIVIKKRKTPARCSKPI